MRTSLRYLAFASALFWMEGGVARLGSAAEPAKLGWAGQRLPSGVARGTRQGEYVLEKTGEVLIYVPPVVLTEFPQGGKAIGGFYLGKFETTVAAFRRFAGEIAYRTDAEKLGSGASASGGFGDFDQLATSSQWCGICCRAVNGASWKNPSFVQAESHPVVLVSWNDAAAFVAWAGARLPTEEEWTVAAVWESQAGGIRQVPWLPAPDLKLEPRSLASKANFADASLFRFFPLPSPRTVLPPFKVLPVSDDGYPYTAPVGSFATGASPYGAQDMAGNVGEWALPEKGSDNGPIFLSLDSRPPDHDKRKRILGGSWNTLVNIAPPITIDLGQGPQSPPFSMMIPILQNDADVSYRSAAVGFRVAVSAIE